MKYTKVIDEIIRDCEDVQVEKYRTTVVPRDEIEADIRTTDESLRKLTQLTYDIENDEYVLSKDLLDRIMNTIQVIAMIRLEIMNYVKQIERIESSKMFS